MKICKTPGAIFHIRTGPHAVNCKIDIPFDLNLSKEGAIELEQKIHDALENILQEYWDDYYWSKKNEKEFVLNFDETFEELLERKLEEKRNEGR